MDPSDAASKVYSEAVVVDGLNVSNWESLAVFDSLNAGGVTAINATIAVWEGYVEAMDNVAAWIRRLGEREANLSQVTGVQDILDAKRSGKTGVILGWQNASPIENDLDRLDLFYGLGVRVIQLTYNESNLLGNGCWERNDDGLSHFGADAVREMNHLAS
jgi:membrane dipeptidase